MADTLPSASWGSFQPGGGGVPASPASSNSGADPVLAMIQNMASPVSQADITAAVTPIGGARTGAVPTTFQRPLTHQDMPLDNREVVGAGNARAQGIGNAITSVTNAIGRFVTKQNQVKQDVLKDQATKVIQSQQAIDEAKTQLDMAKQSGDTATVEKMTNLINEQTQTRDAIFAGKHGKDLAKGFDISYTDPEANKTEYHAAVQAAIKDAKTAQERKAAIQKLQQQNAEQRGKNMGAAYEKAQPQGLTGNTVAQAKVQMAMAQQKIQQEAAKDYLTFKAAMAGHEATVDAAQIRAIAAGTLQQANFNHQQDMLNQRFSQADKVLGERFNQEVKLVWTRAAAAQKTARAIWEDRQANPLTIYQKTQTAYREFSQNMMRDNNTYVQLQNLRQSMYVDAKGNKLKPNDADVRALDGQIQLVKAQIQSDKQTADNLRDQANRMSATFGLPTGDIGDSGGSTSGSFGSSQSDATGEPDYADPLTYLNEDDSN